MLTCIYKGKEMNYSDFVGRTDDDKEIVDRKLLLRKLSDNGELHCKGCGAEARLVDTEKKKKHFRHLKNSECTYDKFAKERKYFENIKLKFYNEINKSISGQSVVLDKRLDNGEWVDIAFIFDNGTTAVLNFVKRSFSESKMDDFHRKCKEMGIVDLWVINGEPSVCNDYEHMYAKDAILLQEDWQDLAIYAPDGENDLTVKFKTIRRMKTGQTFAYVSMPISAFSVNDTGKIPYIEKLAEQKNSEIQKENDSYMEEKRRQLEKQEEVERKAKEKLAEIEQQKIKEKEAKVKQREDDMLELHRRTGKFIGSKIKGEYKLITLEEITLPKMTIAMTPYTKEIFEEKLNDAFNGYAAPIKDIIMKLAQASEEEKNIYQSLMTPYRSLPNDDERFRILAHISKESGLKKYKEKSFYDNFGEKLKGVILENNIEFDEEKFRLFLAKNRSWIQNNYVQGRDDHIMIAKYKNS